MSKNRKTHSPVLRFAPALKGCLFLLFIAGSAIGFIGLKSQLQILARQYQDLEIQLVKLRSDNALRARILDTLQTPSELEIRVQQMNLGMMPPQPEQIVRLMERTVPTPVPSTNLLYANKTIQLKAPQ